MAEATIQAFDAVVVLTFRSFSFSSVYLDAASLSYPHPLLNPFSWTVATDHDGLVLVRRNIPVLDDILRR